MWKLVLVFTLLPALELVVLLQLGRTMGLIPTVLLILCTGITGAWLAKREGLTVLSRVQQSLAGGLPPAEQLMEGALVVGGGLLLITPGIVTDLMGFAAIFPPTRRLIAPVALRALLARFDIRTGAGVQPGPAPAAPPPRAPASDEGTPFDHPFA